MSVTIIRILSNAKSVALAVRTFRQTGVSSQRQKSRSGSRPIGTNRLSQILLT